MPARPHQVAARQAILDDFDAGYRQLVVSMATGTGKTFVFAEMYEALKSRLPGKMLVLAHTEELIDQTVTALRVMYPKLRVDKEMAEHKADPSKADIIVASVASLGRKGTKRVDKYNWDEWDKIVVDEAHHTPANSYRNILAAAGVLQHDSLKLLLGVTATTQRADGKPLEEFYKKISYSYGLRQAIDDGWLVDVKGYRVDTVTSLDGVATSNGDFNKDELADRINNPDRNNRVVTAWTELGQGRQTVVFAANIAHAQALALEFKARGVNAEAIWGEDPLRSQKLEHHRAGHTKVLVNVGVLVEGYDDWRIGCILLARPTQSESLFTQMCGRGTRLQEGYGNLKELQALPTEGQPGYEGEIDCIKQDLIVIDVVDNSSKHSLMTLPSLMGLPDGFDLKGGSAVGALKVIETAQEDNPNVDFTKLDLLTNLTSFIEQVNLFELRFPAEVESNSDLKWCRAVSGGYRMTIPGPMIGNPPRRDYSRDGEVCIKQNLLGQWEIKIDVKNVKSEGVRNTMEEAFVAADHQLRERAKYAMMLLDRKPAWNGEPMKKNGRQHNFLRKLYPHMKFPANMTKGQASFWIDKRMKGKR